MNESIPPEEHKEPTEENVEYWLAQYAEPEPESNVEAGPRFEDVEKMIASFEASFSLEELHAITTITVEELGAHPVRQPAKLALNDILKNIELIKPTVSTEQYDELKMKYKVLSRAIGIHSKGVIDHTR